MYNLPTVQSLREALNQPLGTQLKNLLEDRLVDMLHCGLQNQTHIVVVEAGDTEEQLRHALGFCPFKQRGKGPSNGPSLEWTERHGGWWELLYCRGDYAYIILVEDDVGSPLASFCRRQEA